MVTESYDDGEGALLACVREAVGPAVPILISLDLHANVSPEMVAHADFISSYRTYPHTDWGASGTRCAEWLERVVAAKPRMTRAFRQSPFLIPVTAGCTYVQPSGGLYESLRGIEAETGAHLSLNMGFPPADIHDVGPSIIAYGTDQAAADDAVDRLLDALLKAEAGSPRTIRFLPPKRSRRRCRPRGRRPVPWSSPIRKTSPAPARLRIRPA